MPYFCRNEISEENCKQSTYMLKLRCSVVQYWMEHQPNEAYKDIALMIFRFGNQRQQRRRHHRHHQWIIFQFFCFCFFYWILFYFRFAMSYIFIRFVILPRFSVRSSRITFIAYRVYFLQLVLICLVLFYCITCMLFFKEHWMNCRIAKKNEWQTAILLPWIWGWVPNMSFWIFIFFFFYEFSVFYVFFTVNLHSFYNLK